MGQVSTGATPWKSGFQDQRAARLRQMLRQSKAARRARCLHDQFVALPDTFQILGIAEYAFCFHSTSSCQAQVSFSCLPYITTFGAASAKQGQQAEQASIAQDCSAAKFLDIDLIENFARGG